MLLDSKVWARVVFGGWLFKSVTHEPQGRGMLAVALAPILAKQLHHPSPPLCPEMSNQDFSRAVDDAMVFRRSAVEER